MLLGERLVRGLAVASALSFVGLLALGWALNAGAGFDGVLRPKPHEVDGVFQVLEVEPGSPAASAGIQRGDRVVAIDGNPFVFDSHQAFHNRRAGAAGSLSLSSGEPRRVMFTLESRLNSPVLVLDMAIASLLGIAIVGVGAVVAFVRPRAVVARLLLAFAFGLAISTTQDIWHWTQRTAASASALDTFGVAVMLLGTAALLHLFLIFPAPGRLHRRVKRAVPLLYIVALVPLVLSRVTDSPGVSAVLSTFLLAGLLPGALVALELNYRRPTTPLARAQLGWVRWGLAVGVVATVPHALARLVVPDELPAATSTLVAGAWLVFPISLAMAILRYRLFEVERVVRASIIWGLLATILLAMYAVLVVVLGRLFGSVLGSSIGSEGDPTVSIVAALVVAALVHPVRVRLLGAVGRYVYRHRLARQRLLGEATEHLSQPQSAGDITRFLTQHVPQSLALTGAWLAVPDEAARPYEIDGHALMPNVALAPAALVEIGRSAAGPLLLACAEDLDAYGALPALSAEAAGALPWYLAGARIVVPLRAGNTVVLGLWVLGAPSSGDLFEREDLAVFDRLAGLAALQLERVAMQLERALGGPGAVAADTAEDVLTDREQEVMALLARGYSNRQIADELIIGVRTAETHVQRILRKLSLENRAQAIVRAQQHTSQPGH
ncbi:MAG TPA: LuxR C-terminal-related transcriptional regulator [Chloroflexota bacterium]